MKILFAALTLTVAGLSASAQETAPAPAKAKAEVLKAGSPAPEVKFSKFYKGAAVNKLDADKIYIIECWATWCGPCIAAFPHLSEIAKDSEGKVIIIGVDVWEKKPPAEVQAFVDKQGAKMNYNVAGDADGFISNHWLGAAGQNGIPCAFVVAQGKIAWIGDPGQLDADVVRDLAAGKINGKDMAKRAAVLNEICQEVNTKISPMRRSGNIKGALAACEALVKAKPEGARMLKDMMEKMRFTLLSETNSAEAVKQLLALADNSEYCSRTSTLLEKAKLGAEDAAKLDTSTAARLAKLGAEDGHDKVLLTVTQAEVLDNQGKSADAAALLEKAKPNLDRSEGRFLDGYIQLFKAKAATAAKAAKTAKTAPAVKKN